MIISETRMGQNRYTDFMTLPSRRQYRKTDTTKLVLCHNIRPYLLHKLADHPARARSHSHACKHALPCSGAMDITYIPPLGECMHSPAGQWMARGFIYLAAVLDWFTRRVLSWRVSITLEADFCIEAVEEALARHGKPEISNTDPLFVACRQTPAGRRGGRFTSAEFIKVLAAHKIKTRMPLGALQTFPPRAPHQLGLAT